MVYWVSVHAVLTRLELISVSQSTWFFFITCQMFAAQRVARGALMNWFLEDPEHTPFRLVVTVPTNVPKTIYVGAWQLKELANPHSTIGAVFIHFLITTLQCQVFAERHAGLRTHVLDCFPS